MGVNVATLYRYKQSYCEICNALKKGKDVVDYEVENALVQQAKAGNVTAIIFWLKNRRPDKWRDKPVEDTGQKLDEIKNNIDSLSQILAKPMPERKIEDYE